MDRLDLELYADRLARHADRLADELEAAPPAPRLVERSSVRRALSSRAGEVALLEAVGVLAPTPGGDDRALVERRRGQLEALSRLQAYVERRIDEHR